LLHSLDVGKTEGGLTVEFSPDGKTLAVGNRNSVTTLFDISSGERLHTLDRGSSQELKFSPGGRVLAVTYVDGTLALWRCADGALLRTAKPAAQELFTVNWSPNGEVLATAGLKSNLVLWNVRDLAVLKELEVGEATHCVRFTPDGRRVLASSGSQEFGGPRHVYVWGLPGDRLGNK
jgi:WD40 repeat protein